MTQINRDIPSDVLLPQEVLEVRTGPPNAKDRNIFMVAGCPSQARFLVHNHCLKNLKRGLVERVFCVERNGKLTRTPQPTKGAFGRLSPFRKAVCEKVGVAHRLGYDGFLSYYNGAKLRTYTRAVESLHITPVSERDSHLTTFVKAEKISTAKGDPAPRVIQPRNPRYNVELGRYLRHMESKLMKAVDGVFGETTCIKGYTADEVGAIFREKWDRFDKPVAIGLDASRFDQHCSVEALQYEHSFYRAMYPGNKLLGKLLEWQLHNKGKGYVPDGTITYRKEGCRMSGDINTSLGNYLLMCAMVHGYMRHLGINEFSLANCGDDCVLILERRNLKQVQRTLPEYFLNLGFTMKVEAPVFQLEEVEFCQAHPVQFQGGWKMVRNVRTAMSKDVHCVNNIRDLATRRAWSNAQHHGGLALSAGIPVVETFYSRFKLYDTPRKHQRIDTVTNVHKWRGSGGSYVVTPESRASFWAAFGLTGDEQLALEDRLDRWDMDLFGEEGTDAHEPSILDSAVA